MIVYSKLWTLLEKKGMKKTDLLKVVSSPTLAKLGKNESVNMKVIEQICDYLDCQPGDIMERYNPNDVKDAIDQFGDVSKTVFATLKAQGYTEEQFADMMKQIMPDMIKSMFNGDNALNDIIDKTLDNDTDK